MTDELYVPDSFRLRHPENGDKAISTQAMAQSVVKRPGATEGSAFGPMGEGIIWYAAAVADGMISWGTQITARDRQLRGYIDAENWFASGLALISARNAAFSWYVSGPGTTRMEDILKFADDGEGWASLWLKASQDLYGQDKGAFIHVVRAGDSPASEVIGLEHLDAAQCHHTGDPLKPVLYVDRDGKFHLLNWWQVVTFADFPSPAEKLRGVQHCALTRMLRSSQIMRNIAIYVDEKTGGRHTRAVHIVQGIDQKQIDDQVKLQAALRDNEGALRYVQPTIVSPLDFETPIDVKTLEMSTLPDRLDYDVQVKWYIAQMALAFLEDYQTFAPLPWGNLGTSAQSQVLHAKSRGKGPGLFMKMVVHAMNAYIMPRDTEFGFDEQDIEAEQEIAKVKLQRAQRRKIMVDTGEITPEVAAQVAHDEGDLSEEHLEALGGSDITPDRVEDTERGEKADAGEEPVSQTGLLGRVARLFGGRVDDHDADDDPSRNY